MKKVVLFARDPGGANTIIPLVEELKKEYQVALWGKDVALSKFEAAGLNANNIAEKYAISQEDLKHFLEAESPDILITGTSADDMTEKYLWKLAGEMEIPSLAILDQWMNLGLRFSRYGVNEISQYEKNREHEFLPTRILVMDEMAASGLLSDGIDRERIAITGSPYFQWFQKQIEEIDTQSIEEYRKKKLRARSEEKIFVFASEPMCKTYGEDCGYWGYTEISIFQAFSSALERIAGELKKSVLVIVRPHPKEDVQIWNQRLKNTEFVRYCLDHRTDGKVVMKTADVVVGMSSMFLLESVMCEKQVMSVQIGLKRENPFVLDRIGVLQSIQKEEVLEEQLKCFLNGERLSIDWNIPKQAVEQVISVARELLNE